MIIHKASLEQPKFEITSRRLLKVIVITAHGTVVKMGRNRDSAGHRTKKSIAGLVTYRDAAVISPRDAGTTKTDSNCTHIRLSRNNTFFYKHLKI